MVLLLNVPDLVQAQVRQINMSQPTLNNEPIRVKEGVAATYIQADNLVLQGQFERAIMLYDEALAWDPYDVETLMRRSDLLYKIGRYAEARKDYMTAKRINPYVTDLFNFKNKAARLEILAFEPSKYLSVDPSLLDSNSAAQLKVEAIQKKLDGDMVGALSDINKAIDLAPDNLAVLYKLRGNLYMMLQQYYVAEDDYSRALKLDPEMQEALHNRGIARLYGNKRIDACNDFRESHRLGYQPAGEPLKYLCSK
jgi:tetratricopeptide (TPR) repeat protein